MTDHEINAAIAEACGAGKLFVIRKPIHDPFGYYREYAHGYTGNIAEAWKVTEEVGRQYATGPAYANEPDKVILEPAPTPNYCADLNAMHEAEKTLTVLNIGDYENWLFRTTDYRNTVAGEVAIFWSQHSLYRNVHSTARQRAEAFLRTLGKWKDE